MGCRILCLSETKKIGTNLFKNYGIHIDNYEFLPYLTVAIVIGMQ